MLPEHQRILRWFSFAVTGVVLLTIGCTAPQGTPASPRQDGSPPPAVSPLVAFSDAGRIGIMKSDGSETALLSSGPGDFNPVCSPDGTMIAFTRLYPIDQKGTYVMKADGSGATRVSLAASYYRAPVWSPNSQRLAINDHDQARAGLWLVKADGSDNKRLFESGRPIEGVAWSPDGKRIAFTFNNNPTSGGLYLIDASGGEARVLLDVPQGGLYRAGAMNWSPTGAHIAVRSNPKPAPAGEPAVSPMLSIVKIEQDGAAKILHRVTGLAEGNWEPAWSPNGYTVAIIKQGPNSTHQLAVVSRETGKLEVLGEADRLRSPLWSKEGDQVLVPQYTARAPKSSLLRVALKNPDMSWTMDEDMTDMMKPAGTGILVAASAASWSPTSLAGPLPSEKPAVETEGISKYRWMDLTFKGFT